MSDPGLILKYLVKCPKCEHNFILPVKFKRSDFMHFLKYCRKIELEESKYGKTKTKGEKRKAKNEKI